MKENCSIPGMICDHRCDDGKPCLYLVSSDMHPKENEIEYECPECGLSVPHGIKCHHNL